MSIPPDGTIENNELKELIKSIKNRCDIFLIICDMPEVQGLLPTLLEDLYIDAQEIMDTYCVVHK